MRFEFYGSTSTRYPLEVILSKNREWLSKMSYTKNYILWYPNENMLSSRRFHDAVLFRNALLAERVYSIFDSRKEGAVNFLDYIKGMSRLSNKASVDEKVKCKLSFREDILLTVYYYNM